MPARRVSRPEVGWASPSRPLPVQGDTVTELTEGWAFHGIAIALYDQTAWPILSQSFEAAFAGALRREAGKLSSWAVPPEDVVQRLQLRLLVAPPGEMGLMPEEAYRFYTEAQRTVAPAWVNQVTMESLEKFTEYDPTGPIHLISPTPLLMIIADWLGRTLLAPIEVPVGIIMAVVGGPYLIWILLRQSPRSST